MTDCLTKAQFQRANKLADGPFAAEEVDAIYARHEDIVRDDVDGSGSFFYLNGEEFDAREWAEEINDWAERAETFRGLADFSANYRKYDGAEFASFEEAAEYFIGREFIFFEDGAVLVLDTGA
jgi:hypothetical protein